MAIFLPAVLSIQAHQAANVRCRPSVFAPYYRTDALHSFVVGASLTVAA